MFAEYAPPARTGTMPDSERGTHPIRPVSPEEQSPWPVCEPLPGIRDLIVKIGRHRACYMAMEGVPVHPETVVAAYDAVTIGLMMWGDLKQWWPRLAELVAHYATNTGMDMWPPKYEWTDRVKALRDDNQRTLEDCWPGLAKFPKGLTGFGIAEAAQAYGQGKWGPNHWEFHTQVARKRPHWQTIYKLARDKESQQPAPKNRRIATNDGALLHPKAAFDNDPTSPVQSRSQSQSSSSEGPAAALSGRNR